MANSRERLLEEITRAFLESRDFNGVALVILAAKLGLDWPAIRADLIGLVREQ